MPGFDVGSVRATLTAVFNDRPFNEYDRAYNQASVKASKPVEANLGADFDRRGFAEFDRAVDGARIKAQRAHRVNLGADVDRNSFSQAENAVGRLASAAGGAGRGADEFRVSLGFLGGAARAMGPVLIGVTPVVTALGGALTAVAGSAAAAAGGVGALGIGLAGALTPVGVLAAAVSARFGPIGQALEAVTTQSERAGFEAEQSAVRQQAADARVRASREQVAAAQRSVADAERSVTVAQHDEEFAQTQLNRARQEATRQLQDLRQQVQGLRLDEESASLSVRESQAALDELLRRQRQGEDVSPLEVERARLSVREAQQRLTDVHRERAQAQDELERDRRLGINQMPQVVAAQRALEGAQRQVAQQIRAVADAERRVTSTTRDLGDAHRAASSDVSAGIDQVALAMARLDPAERRFVGVLQRVRAQVQEATRPATDAVIGGLGAAATSAGNFAQRLSAPFARLGEAIGDAIAEGAGELTSNRFLQRFQVLIRSATRMVEPFKDGLVAVADIFTNIAVAAQPFVRDVVGALSRGLQGIAGQTSDVGAVRDVIRDLLRSTRDWFNLFRAVGQLLFTVFSGGKSAGDSMVVSLTHVVDRWNAFLQTERGQRELRQFLHDSVQATKLLASIVGALASTFFDLGRTIDHVASDPMGAFRETLRQVQESRIVDWAKEVADVFDDAWNSIAETAEDVFRGVREVVLRAFDKILDVAEELPGVGGKFRDLREGVQRDLQAIAEERHTDRIRDNLRRVREASEDTADSFHDLERRHANSFENIQNVTAERTDKIRRDMGRNTAEGRAAMADNFRRAAQAVQKSMDDGRTSTREGTRAIHDYMVGALQVYGVTLSQARSIVRINRSFGARDEAGSGDTGHQRGGMVRRFMQGGWLVGKGLLGSDTVQVGPGAWAAPGEYQALGPGNLAGIFTRHQQREMSPFLAQGGYTWDTLPRDQRALPLLEALTSQIGGLATVFSAIDRPHMFQGGGFVQAAADTGSQGLTSAVSALARRLIGMGFVVTDAFRPGGTTYHGSGQALDFGNSVNDLGRLWRVLFPQRAQFAELFGPRGLYHGTQQFSSPGLQAQHNDHIHVALTGALGRLGAAVAARVPRVVIEGGGAVGRVAQGAVDMVRAGANRALQRAAGTTGVHDGAGDVPVSGSGVSLMRQIARQRGWDFGDWWRIDERETGHGTNLVNPTSTARLRGQFLSTNWGKYGPGSDPRQNPSVGQQIVSMAQYIAERYGNPSNAWAHEQQYGWYRRGGLLRRGMQSGGIFGGPGSWNPTRLSSAGFPQYRPGLALWQRGAARLQDPGNRIRQLLQLIDDLTTAMAVRPNDVGLMQQLLLYEQEVVRLAQRVGNNDLVRQYAPEVRQLRQDIRDAQAPPFTRQDRLDRDLAVAQFGGDPAQIRGVLAQQLGGAQGRLARARRRGDVTGETQAVQDVASLTQSIQELDQQVADKARQDAENARQARVQALDTRDALAALTSGLGDDAEAVNASVAFWNDQLARAQESGDPAAIAEAARGFGSAVQRQDQVADAIRRQPLAWLEANQAQARLTETLDDDINSARDMVGFWQNMLDQARRDQSPERITEAAGNLASATENLSSTLEQQSQTTRQVTDAAAQMLRDFQDNLRTLYGSMGSNYVIPGYTPPNPYGTPGTFGALGGTSIPARPNVTLNVTRVVETSDPHIWSQAMAREASLAF